MIALNAGRVSHLKLTQENMAPLSVSVFSTPLSWMALLGRNNQLISVYVGHPTSKSILQAAKKLDRDFEVTDWNSELRSQREAYASGEPIDFQSLEISLPAVTSFRRNIIAATRSLAYGQTISYGDLARQAGYPRAARAVGTVMSSNRFPILIPCHRVLAAGGKLGGYTSPLGTSFKQRLLEMESRYR